MKAKILFCFLCVSLMGIAQTASTHAQQMIESVTRDVTLSAEQTTQLTSAAAQYVSAIQTANDQYDSDEETLVQAKASAWQALLPLFRGTVSNIQETISPAKALTGPITRGDIITIQKHLQVLPQEYLNIYCSLGYETTNLAFASGAIDENTAQQLEAIFKTAQNKEI